MFQQFSCVLFLPKNFDHKFCKKSNKQTNRSQKTPTLWGTLLSEQISSIWDLCVCLYFSFWKYSVNSLGCCLHLLFFFFFFFRINTLCIFMTKNIFQRWSVKWTIYSWKKQEEECFAACPGHLDLQLNLMKLPFCKSKQVQLAVSYSSVGKESACNAGDPSLIPGLGRSAGEGIGYPLQYSWASLVTKLAKNLPAVWETWVRSLGWEDATAVFQPEEFHVLCSPWGSQRVGHDWATFTSIHFTSY